MDQPSLTGARRQDANKTDHKNKTAGINQTSESSFYIQVEKQKEKMKIMGEVKERWCPYFDHDLLRLFAFDSRWRIRRL